MWIRRCNQPFLGRQLSSEEVFELLAGLTYLHMKREARAAQFLNQNSLR